MLECGSLHGSINEVRIDIYIWLTDQIPTPVSHEAFASCLYVLFFYHEKRTTILSSFTCPVVYLFGVDVLYFGLNSFKSRPKLITVSDFLGLNKENLAK